MNLTPRCSAAVLIGACALCFGTTLGGAFHYDDFHSIVENRAIRDGANIPRFFTDPSMFSADVGKAMYRPLLLISYTLNYAVAAYDTTWWRGTNLLFHTIAVLLLWSLARHLLGNEWGALAAGLLFAVHPLASEPVNYISSRSELLSVCFYLAAFLTYARTRGGGRGRWLSVACFVLALLSKSTAITLPVALLVYELVSRPVRPGWAEVRDRVAALWAHWGAAVGYLAVIVANGFLGKSVAAPVRPMAAQIATQLKASAYYLKLLAVPWGQSVEHQFSESTSLLDGPVLMAGVLCLSLLAIAFRGLRRSRRFPAGYAIVWSAIVLLPTSLMPLNVLVNERRLYLVVGIMGIGLGALLRRRERWMAAAGLPLLVLLTLARNPVWATELSLWRDAACRGPGMPRAWSNYSEALLRARAWAEAEEAAGRAMELAPERPEPANNLANALSAQGTDAGAIGAYLLALDRAGGDRATILVNLADSYRRLGDDSAARRALEEALLGKPDLAAAHYHLGKIEKQAGHLEAASRSLKRAAALDSTHVGTGVLRAEVEASLGHARCAVHLLQHALAQDSLNPRAWYDLAELHDSLGQVSQAQQAYRQFLDHWGRRDRRYAHVQGRIRALEGGD